MEIIENLDKVSKICNSTKIIWFFALLSVVVGLFVIMWLRVDANMVAFAWFWYSFLTLFALMVLNFVIYHLIIGIVGISDIFGFKKESQID